jgi:hypothetical protein
MAKIKSFGATVYLNGIAIGGLTDINATGTDVSMIDTTSHDAGGGFRTFVSGLKDGGTLELTGKYNYTDAGQAEWKAEEGIKHTFYIILSDKSGLAFEAFVGGFQTSNPLDDATEFTATAKITGEVFPVYPTITITGISDPVDSDPVVLSYSGFGTGKPQWSGGGFLLSGNSIEWEIASSAYGANITTSAIVPQGLTGWTITDGAGQPTLTGS